jgi:hypothetical protein
MADDIALVISAALCLPAWGFTVPLASTTDERLGGFSTLAGDICEHIAGCARSVMACGLAEMHSTRKGLTTFARAGCLRIVPATRIVVLSLSAGAWPQGDAGAARCAWPWMAQLCARMRASVWSDLSANLTAAVRCGKASRIGIHGFATKTVVLLGASTMVELTRGAPECILSRGVGPLFRAANVENSEASRAPPDGMANGDHISTDHALV